MNGPIVVIVSARAEWQVVREHFTEATPRSAAPGEWFQVEMDVGARKEQVVFLHGGFGKIAAAASAQFCVDRWSPRLLVNLGTCGGFDGLVDRGTIILVERTVVYDIYDEMGDPQACLARFTTEIDLSWLPEAYPQEVTKTVLVSGDRDLQVDDLSGLTKTWGAIAGDWESGAVAWVAQRNGVRCLILRGVSDLVGAGGGEAYGDYSVFVDGARQVMANLLDHLPAWLALLPAEE